LRPHERSRIDQLGRADSGCLGGHPQSRRTDRSDFHFRCFVIPVHLFCAGGKRFRTNNAPVADRGRRSSTTCALERNCRIGWHTSPQTAVLGWSSLCGADDVSQLDQFLPLCPITSRCNSLLQGIPDGCNRFVTSNSSLMNPCANAELIDKSGLTQTKIFRRTPPGTS
jgi:hypothetical protein